MIADKPTMVPKPKMGENRGFLLFCASGYAMRCPESDGQKGLRFKDSLKFEL